MIQVNQPQTASQCSTTSSNSYVDFNLITIPQKPLTITVNEVISPTNHQICENFINGDRQR